MAASRVAEALGVSADFIVGDARYLPFRDSSFHVVFSYSVIQHFARQDAQSAVREMARVLGTGGYALIQMAHAIGVRALYHRMRARFRESHDFGVRYWSLKGLRDLFGRTIGSTSFEVDCFFGVGLQVSDIAMMPPGIRAAIRVSEVLRRLGRHVRPLVYAADSVYVRAAKDLRSVDT